MPTQQMDAGMVSQQRHTTSLSLSLPLSSPVPDVLISISALK